MCDVFALALALAVDVVRLRGEMWLGSGRRARHDVTRLTFVPAQPKLLHLLGRL
jgi:hypothetical protein